MNYRKPIILICLFSLSLVLVGCGRTLTYDAQVLNQETFTARSPYQVFASPPAQAQSFAINQPASNSYRWWQLRNDSWVSTRQPSETGELVLNDIETVDRQRSHDGHIHNHYRRTSRSRRIGGYVR